jgi:hypothetical protein
MGKFLSAKAKIPPKQDDKRKTIAAPLREMKYPVQLDDIVS